MSSPGPLVLRFSGRIIDHLGIQMYQSPVAAIAEMVSNAWDADAERVSIKLPESLSEDATIVISDNGAGMTYEECQDRYLAVGANRRGDRHVSYTARKMRPELGRKGIGKFAGFGIATVIEVDTISRETGERTVFALDSAELRQGEYVNVDNRAIALLNYEPPSPERAIDHGTVIRLQYLTLARRPSVDQFLKSMARRFLLHQTVDDFKVFVNDRELPASDDLEDAQFVFPKQYLSLEATSRPEGLDILEDGSGVESLSNGQKVKWRFVFRNSTIDEEELQGISVFAHGKLAQAPFFFHLAGGLGGQHGMEYLTGKLEADYVDEFSADLIATERQRIDWTSDQTAPLLEWGQARVKELLVVWKGLRSQEKLDALADRMSVVSQRLDRLPRYDRRIVETALRKLAGVETINDQLFLSLSNAVLTAWEGGRLRDLIADISQSQDLTETGLLELLLEAEVLTAIHMAEAVKTKLETIESLRGRIASGERENPLRDFIAQHPWLISPEWETFEIERSIENIIRLAAAEAKLDREPDWDRRIDLTLSSGDSLVVLEFMKPGLTVDWDHISRFRQYVTAVKTRVQAQTAGPIRRVAGGYLVADRLEKNPTNLAEIQVMAEQSLYCMDWETLLLRAESQWKDFITILATRAPEDQRVAQFLPETDESAVSKEL